MLTYKKYNLLIFSKYLIVIGVILLILYILSKIKNFKFNKFEIFIFVLMILSTLSLINAIDINTALYGKINRREGLFVIYTYYLIALNTSNIRKDIFRKIIIGFIILLGSINIFYGLCQTDFIKINNLLIMAKWYFAKGFNGNSMGYVALLSICYPITIGLFLKKNKIYMNILYFILMSFFCFGFLNSGSMAGFLASIVLFIFIVIKYVYDLIKKDNNKKDLICYGVKILISVAVFITCYFALININNNFENDIKEMYSESNQIVKNKKLKDNYGTGRIHIWKSTIPVIRDNPIFGVGIDNFRNAFNPNLVDVKSGLVVDKAHNEYLQKIVCEGLLSGILYIVFLFFIFIKGIKTKDNLTYALLLSFICYSTQAFFNISVTRVAPIFFIVIGLLVQNPSMEEK